MDLSLKFHMSSLKRSRVKWFLSQFGSGTEFSWICFLPALLNNLTSLRDTVVQWLPCIGLPVAIIQLSIDRKWTLRNHVRYKSASKLCVLKGIEPRKPPLGCCLLKTNSAQFFSSPKSSQFWLRQHLAVKTWGGKKQKNNSTCSHIKRISSRQGCTLTTYFGEDLHNQSAPRPPRVGWVGCGRGVTTCSCSFAHTESKKKNKQNRIRPISCHCSTHCNLLSISRAFFRCTLCNTGALCHAWRDRLVKYLSGSI